MNESQALSASGAEAAAVKDFGDLPLLVLTGRQNTMPGWQEWQAELLQLSSNSQQLFAENSGHTVHMDQPDAAVAAILQMVRQGGANLIDRRRPEKPRSRGRRLE